MHGSMYRREEGFNRKMEPVIVVILGGGGHSWAEDRETEVSLRCMVLPGPHHIGDLSRPNGSYYSTCPSLKCCPSIV